MLNYYTRSWKELQPLQWWLKIVLKEKFQKSLSSKVFQGFLSSISSLWHTAWQYQIFRMGRPDSLNPTTLNNQIPRSQIFQSKDFKSLKLAEISADDDDEHFGFISSVFVRIIFSAGHCRGDDHIKRRGSWGAPSTDQSFWRTSKPLSRPKIN